ncbi:MAG: hypothetical protein IT497_07170 [Ottowia sp.]|nr:hypothetical protein [Ottowia sp.]
MKILLTPLAKEDMDALAMLDASAYMRLCRWIKREEMGERDDMQTARLCIHPTLSLFSWPLSPVHRVIFARRAHDVLLLQCRFHF